MYPHFPNVAALLSFGLPLLLVIGLGVVTARSRRTAGMFALIMAGASAFLGTIGPVPGFAFGNCIQTWAGFILAVLSFFPAVGLVRRGKTLRNFTVLFVTLYLSAAWGVLISGCSQDETHHNDVSAKLVLLSEASRG